MKVPCCYATSDISSRYLLEREIANIVALIIPARNLFVRHSLLLACYAQNYILKHTNPIPPLPPAESTDTRKAQRSIMLIGNSEENLHITTQQPRHPFSFLPVGSSSSNLCCCILEGGPPSFVLENVPLLGLWLKLATGLFTAGFCTLGMVL